MTPIFILDEPRAAKRARVTKCFVPSLFKSRVQKGRSSLYGGCRWIAGELNQWNMHIPLILLTGYSPTALDILRINKIDVVSQTLDR